VADCLEKLRTILADVCQVPEPRKPTGPTRASIFRRLKQKRAKSEKKQSRRLREPE